MFSWSRFLCLFLEYISNLLMFFMCAISFLPWSISVIVLIDNLGWRNRGGHTGVSSSFWMNRHKLLGKGWGEDDGCSASILSVWCVPELPLWVYQTPCKGLVQLTVCELWAARSSLMCQLRLSFRSSALCSSSKNFHFIPVYLWFLFNKPLTFLASTFAFWAIL